MKSIIFAALIAYASATSQFENVANDGEQLPDSNADQAAASEVAAPVEPVDPVEPVAPSDDAVAAPEVDTTIDTDLADTLIATENYEAETAAWETETKINTTDYFDNAETKKEMEDFEWDSFDMSEFTFTDLLNLLNNDQQVTDLKDQVQNNYVNWYTAEATKLPQVCEAG
jgi:hypothetical protein